MEIKLKNGVIFEITEGLNNIHIEKKESNEPIEILIKDCRLTISGNSFYVM